MRFNKVKCFFCGVANYFVCVHCRTTACIVCVCDCEI
jgi:hypothetical protein